MSEQNNPSSNPSLPTNNSTLALMNQQSLKMDILQFKDEVLRDIKIQKRDLVDKFDIFSDKFNDKIKGFDKKLTSYDEKVNELHKMINETKIVNTDINSLFKFKEKTNEFQVTTQTKILNLEKEMRENIYRLDNILNDSVNYIGLIGSNSKFKTFHDFIDYTLTQISKTNIYKEKTSTDLSSYKKKIESLINNFQSQTDSLTKVCNNYSLKKCQETEEKCRKLIELYDERLKNTRAENLNYIQNLEKDSKNLQTDFKKIEVFKNVILKIFDEKINFITKEKEEEFKMYTHFKKEFLLLKDRFTQLSEFIKDVRFRVNLGQEVKRREYFHISTKIDFNQKQKVDEKVDENMKKEIENRKREEMLFKVIEEVNNQEKNEEKKDNDTKTDNNININDINSNEININNTNTNYVNNDNTNSNNNIKTNTNNILSNENNSSLNIKKNKEINIQNNQKSLESTSNKNISNLKKNSIDAYNKKYINTNDNNNTNNENKKTDIPKISQEKIPTKKLSPRKISPGKDNKKPERKNSKNNLSRNSPKKQKIINNTQSNKSHNSTIEDKKISSITNTINPIAKEKEKLQRNFSAFTYKERTVNSLVNSTNYNKNTNLRQKLQYSNSTGDVINFPYNTIYQKITIDSTRKNNPNNIWINNIENDNSIDVSKSKNSNKNESSIFLRQKQSYANLPKNENHSTQNFRKNRMIKNVNPNLQALQYSVQKIYDVIENNDNNKTIKMNINKNTLPYFPNMFQSNIDNINIKNNSRNQIQINSRNNEVKKLETMINNLKSYLRDNFEDIDNYRSFNNLNNRRHLTKNLSYCKIQENEYDEFNQMRVNNNNSGDKVKENKRYRVKSSRPKSHYVELKFTK